MAKKTKTSVTREDVKAYIKAGEGCFFCGSQRRELFTDDDHQMPACRKCIDEIEK